MKDNVLVKRSVSVLEKIEESLASLNEKMEVILELQKKGGEGARSVVLPDASLDVMTLLSMPDHLRKTAMAICRCGRATAEEIAQQTEIFRRRQSGPCVFLP